MAKNIFKKIETVKEPPMETKEDIISKIEDIEKGKALSGIFNTKLYGALVNFFKIKEH